ncbi:TPA: DUF4365 domain-containing protein [Burkholderia vietnamiensis]|nr:DUF4365 domain-containing protein [Burkholderia vietnamiensis]
MKSSPKIPMNRRAEREGINAAQAFFERNNCVFQEVALQNDFGKDAYLDVTRDGVFGPLCVALQIKSGRSYRTDAGNYLIPLNHHAETWRDSTVPIFGVVYDPDDLQLRWIDLTGYLRDNPGKITGAISVEASSMLTDASLTGEFLIAVQRYSSASGALIVPNIFSDVPDQQIDAIFDAWALGRSDARYLLLLRRAVLELCRDATRRAIWLLAHVTSHPDIFWTPNNWIPEDVKRRVRTSFRWSAEEIYHMFMALDVEEMGRGTLGQSLHLILLEDGEAIESMKQAVGRLLQMNQINHAMFVLVTMLASSKDPKKILEEMLSRYAVLLENEWCKDIRISLREENRLDIY